MRTKTSNFLNIDSLKPEFSFEYFCAQGGVWRYPLIGGTKEPMRWASSTLRDHVQGIFRWSKTACDAYERLAGSYRSLAASQHAHWLKDVIGGHAAMQLGHSGSAN